MCKKQQVNSKIGGEFFPNVACLCLFTDRICQNVLSEVPLDSSIVANFANYHCKSFIGSLNATCVEFQEMIYRLATLVECSLCESGEKGRERLL